MAPIVRRTISASTSTTALSMMMPKSTAPSEIRFADTPERVHQDEREEQRERYHHSHRQRSLPATQEDEQDRHHQHGAEREILGDRAHRVRDELGAVVVGHEPHPARQPGLEELDLALDVAHHLHRVAALDHLHDALHHLVLVVEHDDARARPRTDHHFAQIARHDRASVAGGDDHLGDVVQAAEDADAADHHRLVAAPQQAAARVGAVPGQGLGHLVDGDVVLAQAVGIDPELVLLHHAAEAHHVGDIGNPAQRRADHPVLDGPHLRERHVFRRLDHVAEHLAHRVGERTERRLGTRRQRHGLQLFHHLLTREIIVGAVREGERHHREAGHRDRTQLGHARQPAHLALDRQRNGALDLLRRLARKLGDDQHLHVLHVGKGFDRQLLPRVQAGHGDHGRYDDDEDPLLQGEGDEPVQHRATPRSPVPN